MTDRERQGKRVRKQTNRFDADEYENEDMMLLQQAIKNSKAETVRVDVSTTVPEARTFYPTAEEFERPFEYIFSIAPEAEKTGICKIVPPPEWNPPNIISMTDPRRLPTKLQKLHKLQEGENVFPDGHRYSINEYKAMADEFKRKWLLTHYGESSTVSHDDLARDYWRIVETQYLETQVEYANDIDTHKYVSGFPKVSKDILDHARRHRSNEDRRSPHYYATSDWNLNNIANAFGSVLKPVEAPINGINVPWLYLGMLFSTFCWHVEDNYLYSINYHHMGEVKQWYGVPAESHSTFEKISRDFYRETVLESPDMLHHMTTQIAVSRLVTNRVPVYQAKQQARSFIITFPKAFHCGFSYGFNVGEAVNFALVDWLPFGADADFRYRNSPIPRPSVFSHVRLLFTLLQYSHELNDYGKRELYRQLENVISDEIKGRGIIQAFGIVDPRASKTAFTNNFDTIDDAAIEHDDRRACVACKEICIFSAIACECNDSNVSCWRHFELLCRCRKSEFKVDAKQKSSSSGSPNRRKRQFLISWASVDELQRWLAIAKEKLLTD